MSAPTAVERQLARLHQTEHARADGPELVTRSRGATVTPKRAARKRQRLARQTAQRLAVVALALLVVTPAAQAANPAQVVAGKLTTLHRSLNHYPAGARTVTACSGVPGGREWRCTVKTSSPSMLNGSDSWRYVCTGRAIRRGHGLVIVNFKAYAVGGIA